MLRARLLLVLALTATTPGCLDWLVGEDSPPVDVATADVTVVLLRGRAWLNATLEAPAGAVRWTLLRDVGVVDAGNATNLGNLSWSATTTKPIAGNGTWRIRFTDAGLVVAERAFTLASPAWAPQAAGVWAFSAERNSSGERALRLDGTLRGRSDGWRLDAAGTLRDEDPNGTLVGEVLHFAIEGRDEAFVVARVLVAARLTTPAGAPVGNVSSERTLLREGGAADVTGAQRDGFLYRSWTRVEGRLAAAAGGRVDTVTIVEQWVARDGTPLRWNRTTLDNATARQSHDSGFGAGDDAPKPLELVGAAAPSGLAPGDAFVAGPRLFRAVAEAGGIVAEAAGARLRRASDGALREYDETAVVGATTTRVVLSVPG